MGHEDWYAHLRLAAEMLVPGVQRLVLRSEGEKVGESAEIVQLDLNLEDNRAEENVLVQFRATSQEDAWSRGVWWSQEFASIVSFLTSRRTRVDNLCVTNRPRFPVPSKSYCAMLAPNAATTIATPPVVNPADFALLLRAKPERVSRALRWLRKARENPGTNDEFICLIVSLESISHLLGSSGYVCWQCAHCQKEVETCPECGGSTRRRKSGAETLRSFTSETLNWSKGDWQTVWDLRNSLLHGEQDVVGEASYDLLSRVESAVIAALKKVLDLPSSHAPTNAGLRGLMVGAEGIGMQARRDSIRLEGELIG